MTRQEGSISSGTAKVDDSSVWSSGHTWMLLAIVLFGALLRARGLVGFAYWEDELYSITESRQLFASEFNTGIELRPLYFLVQHVLLAGFGESPLVLRIVPFIVGVGGVLAVALLARRVFGSTAALVAALFAAMAPWPIYASQVGRYWSMTFCFGALFFWALFRAEATGRVTHYAWACLFALLGLASHPSFAFPFPAMALALCLVRPDGTLGWRWPSRAAMLGLWVPLAIIVGLWYTITLLRAGINSFHNDAPSPLGTAGRLVPAIVYAVSPSVVTAAAVGALVCWAGRATAAQVRFGAVAVASVIGSVATVVWFAARSQVSAPYATSIEPLLLVLAAAPVCLLDRLPSRAHGLAAFAFASVVAGGMSAQTASQLLDGTRFDFRPALAFIREQEPHGVVAIWPIVQATHYAPDLVAYDLPTNDTVTGLDSLYATGRDFWVLAAYKRFGMVFDPVGRRQAWVAGHCQWRADFGRSRFDYQDFKLEVHRCGSQYSGGAAVAGAPASGPPGLVEEGNAKAVVPPVEVH
jgi:hypothetical protein